MYIILYIHNAVHTYCMYTYDESTLSAIELRLGHLNLVLELRLAPGRMMYSYSTLYCTNTCFASGGFPLWLSDFGLWNFNTSVQYSGVIQCNPIPCLRMTASTPTLRSIWSNISDVRLCSSRAVAVPLCLWVCQSVLLHFTLLPWMCEFCLYSMSGVLTSITWHVQYI